MFVLFFRRQACGALEGGQLVAREVYPPALAGAVEFEDVIGLAVDEAVVALAELIGLIAPLIARLLLVPGMSANPTIHGNLVIHTFVCPQIKRYQRF